MLEHSRYLAPLWYPPSSCPFILLTSLLLLRRRCRRRHHLPSLPVRPHQRQQLLRRAPPTAPTPRDVPYQFPWRLSVSDLAPNLSNVSVYGQVVSVACVAGSSLPPVLPPSRAAASANQASAPSSSFLSQLPLKPVMLLHQQQRQQQQQQQQHRQASSAKVVELWVRDEGGKARVFCCGRRAAADALRCR